MERFPTAEGRVFFSFTFDSFLSLLRLLLFPFSRVLPISLEVNVAERAFSFIFFHDGSNGEIAGSLLTPLPPHPHPTFHSVVPSPRLERQRFPAPFLMDFFFFREVEKEENRVRYAGIVNLGPYCPLFFAPLFFSSVVETQ